MVKITKKSNILRNLVLVSVVLLVGFVLGNLYQSNKLSPSNTLSEGNVDQIIPLEWLTYTHEPFATPQGWEEFPWAGFKMYYPSSWTIDEEKRNETTGELMIHGSKEDGSYFDLSQGFGDGGRCLFSDESDYTTFQGNGTGYEKFIQISKSDVKWRLATYNVPDDLWTHALCQEKDGRYYSGNAIGIHKIKLTTQESTDEFTEILQKLEILR